MTVQEFIEKAIEGGWSLGDMAPGFKIETRKADSGWWVVCETGKTWAHYPLEKVLLLPEAWMAVGKVEGNEKWNHLDGTGYRDRMHRMIDALADGRTIESYLARL